MSTEAYRAARRDAVRAFYWRHHEQSLARRRAQSRALAARSDDEIAADRQRLRPDGCRTCPRCRRHRVFTAFSLSRHSPDGLSSACRDCHRVQRA